MNPEAIREVEDAARKSVAAGKVDEERLLKNEAFIRGRESDTARHRRSDQEQHIRDLIADSAPSPSKALEKALNRPITPPGLVIGEERKFLRSEIDRLKKALRRAEGELKANASSWRDTAQALIEARRQRPTDKFGRGVTRYDLDEEEEVHETTHVLDRASELVCGDRARDYGDPTKGYALLAEAWTAYLQVNEGELDARDVINLMIILKVFRDRNKRKADTPIDIAGYAQLNGWIGDPRGE